MHARGSGERSSRRRIRSPRIERRCERRFNHFGATRRVSSRRPSSPLSTDDVKPLSPGLAEPRDDLEEPLDDLRHPRDDVAESSDRLRKLRDDVVESRDDVEESSDDVLESRDDVEESSDDVLESRDDVLESRDDVEESSDDVEKSSHRRFRRSSSRSRLHDMPERLLHHRHEAVAYVSGPLASRFRLRAVVS